MFVLLMLALDLGVFHRKSHVVKFKESITWTLIWIVLAMGFGVLIYYWKGSEKAIEFLTGYVIELSLSVDNLFVFILIFSYFRVPQEYQHKVLFWGILGALVLRVIFIFAGVALLTKFHWLIYVFGLIIIVSGIKMLFQKEKKLEPDKNPIIRLVKKMIPVTSTYHEDKLFVKINKVVWAATPLFIVLVFVEITDLIFAVDSIPAILAITTDTFIVFTSNVFAILGLRSLYFSLAGMINLFRYLHLGLSFILIFIGLKMVFSEVYKIPIEYALITVLCILITSIAASILIKDKKAIHQ